MLWLEGKPCGRPYLLVALVFGIGIRAVLGHSTVAIAERWRQSEEPRQIRKSERNAPDAIMLRVLSGGNRCLINIRYVKSIGYCGFGFMS